MIKPIPPKFKVVIAGIVFIVGILGATRFPAEKTEKLFVAHKREAVSGTQTDSAVTLLRPTTALSLDSAPKQDLDIHSPLVQAEPTKYPLDIQENEIPPDDALPKPLADHNVASKTPDVVNSETFPDEVSETELPEEQKYQPFQGEKPTLASLENREFQRSGPTPPVIFPTRITQEEPMIAGLQGLQQLETSPILEPVTVRPINSGQVDSGQSSLAVVVPVTGTAHRVFYPDSGTQSKSTGKVVTAHGTTLILPNGEAVKRASFGQ